MPRLGLGSSSPLALRQRLDQRRHRPDINRSADPHPSAGRKLDLDSARTLRRGTRWRLRSKARLGGNRDRIEGRGKLRPLAELLAPAEELARVNAGRARNLGSNRTWLQRSRNDPLLLGPRSSPAPLHRRDHLNLRLGHKLVLGLLLGLHACARLRKAAVTGRMHFGVADIFLILLSGRGLIFVSTLFFE